MCFEFLTKLMKITIFSQAFHLKCVRFLYSYPNSNGFKRIVIKASAKNNSSPTVTWDDISPLFLQYYFENGKQDISVPCHGNSKKKTCTFLSLEGEYEIGN